MFAVLIAGYASAQTKSAVKVSDLKKEITAHVAKAYPGYTIKDAFKVEKNKVVTFEVNATKDASKITLVYDEKGAFVKSETPKAATTTTTQTGVKTQTGTKTQTSPNPTGKPKAGTTTK